MDKFAKYIPYVLLALFGFMLWRMSKVQNMHTALLIGMAGKMGVIPEQKAGVKGNRADGKKHQKEIEAEDTETDPVDEDEEIVRIAEKLYAGKILNKKDKDYYFEHKKDIDEEAVFFMTDDLQRISNLIKESKEITSDDVEFYKKNFDEYSEDLKLEELPADIKIIEKQIVQISSEEDRKHLILSFLDDGIPKTIGAFANLFAEKTGLAPSTGNTAKVLDKLLAEEKLKNQKIACGNPKRNKVFYGFPDWFDGKKFQKEYLKKIA